MRLGETDEISIITTPYMYKNRYELRRCRMIQLAAMKPTNENGVGEHVENAMLKIRSGGKINRSIEDEMTRYI